LEQQTATSEVLGVISSSPGELNPVFNAMLENAVRLCEAEFGHLYLCDKEAFHPAALHSASQDLGMLLRRRPVVLRGLHPDAPLSRMARTKAVVDIADVRLEKIYVEREPTFSEFVDVSGARAILIMPMLKENELIGAFVIYRLEVRPFTDKQIALVKNFAAQAVIAIENARLLNELRERTADLTESLEQQTATSEVLRVISSSSGNLQTVFDTMLTEATDLCEASYGLMWLREEDAFRAAALYGDLPQAYRDQWRSGTRYRPGPETILSRVTASGRPIQVPDLRIDPSYLIGDPLPVAAADVAGVRTLLGVPMLRDTEVVGFIGIYRKEIRPFTEKQVTLVTNFAAQAVIAIENTRLLNELRQSLEQQTATSQVLSVISSSPGELEPVFQAMLTNATRICEAVFGNLYLYEADAFRMVAAHHDSPAYVAARTRNPLLRPPPDAPLGRLAITKQMVQVADIRTLPSRDHPFVAAGVAAGYRTVLAIPLLKDDELIGAFTMIRQEVRAFTDKQIALLTNFARQAVIAIENARLLKELREMLEQQTATADVLGVISSSPGELEPVFQTVLENATRICGANFANLLLYENGAFRRAALFGAPPSWREDAFRDPVIRPNETNPIFRIMKNKEVVIIPDLAADQAYLQREPAVVAVVEKAGARSIIAVPMLKEDELVGLIAVFHQEIRPFTDKQISLLQNFAAQAVRH